MWYSGGDFTAEPAFGMTGEQRFTMLRTLNTVLLALKPAWPHLAAAAMALPMAGCLGTCKPVITGKPDLDLFAPETVEMMIKEPVILAGMVLTIEVTAGGMQVFPGGPKIVSLRGDIVMPLIPEPVECAGMTCNQLMLKLAEAYEVLYNKPSVSVMFVQDPQNSPYGTVGIYGQVGREGPISLPTTSRLSLTQAIQMAGGLSPLANRRRIQVTRAATPKELPQLTNRLSQTREFSWVDISAGIIPDPPLLKDDVVRVIQTFL